MEKSILFKNNMGKTIAVLATKLPAWYVEQAVKRKMKDKAEVSDDETLRLIRAIERCGGGLTEKDRRIAAVCWSRPFKKNAGFGIAAITDEEKERLSSYGNEKRYIIDTSSMFSFREYVLFLLYVAGTHLLFCLVIWFLLIFV